MATITKDIPLVNIGTSVLSKTTGSVLKLADNTLTNVADVVTFQKNPIQAVSNILKDVVVTTISIPSDVVISTGFLAAFGEKLKQKLTASSEMLTSIANNLLGLKPDDATATVVA